MANDSVPGTLQIWNSFPPGRSIVWQNYRDSLCTTEVLNVSRQHSTSNGFWTPVSQKWFCFKLEIDFLGGGGHQLFPGFWHLCWDRARFASSVVRLSWLCLTSVFWSCSLTLQQSQPATHAICPSAFAVWFFIIQFHFSAVTQHMCVDKSRENPAQQSRGTHSSSHWLSSLWSAVVRIWRTKIRVPTAQRPLPQKAEARSDSKSSQFHLCLW